MYLAITASRLLTNNSLNLFYKKGEGYYQEIVTFSIFLYAFDFCKVVFCTTAFSASSFCAEAFFCCSSSS